MIVGLNFAKQIVIVGCNFNTLNSRLILFFANIGLVLIMLL